MVLKAVDTDVRPHREYQKEARSRQTYRDYVAHVRTLSSRYESTLLGKTESPIRLIDMALWVLRAAPLDVG